MIRFPSPIHCAAFLMATGQVAVAAPTDKTDSLRTSVLIWEGASLAGTFVSMCEDLKTDVVGRSNAEIKLLGGCGMFYEIEKVAAAAEEGIQSGNIGFHNAKSKLSPEILEQAARDGFQKRYVDAASQPRAIAPPIKPSSGLSGNWCWESPSFTAREANGPSSASLSLNLMTKGTVGSTVTGNHCAVMQWGDRIDCADQGETTVSGLVREGYSSITVTSAYSGKDTKARLFPTVDGLRYVPIPMTGVEHYLPSNEVVLKRCDK